MYCFHCMNQIDDDSQVCPVCGKLPITRQPNHHLQPGAKLNGRYVIGNSIGEGGFGITYIGRDENLDLRVAVKEYYPSGIVLREPNQHLSVIQSGDNENLFFSGRSKFIDESRTLAKFSGSDGIVNVRDYFEENNTAYIVMEYLEGKTLRETIKENGTLRFRDSVALLAPVMEALIGIHAHGLIHRDISPDNIMLTKSKVKLLDFGSARDISSDSNTVIIKPGFAPEEQYRSNSVQTEALDVYSLSATIYYCITGIVPPAGITRVHQDALQTPSQLGVTISPQEEQVLLKGLNIMAQDRYQSVTQLQTALEASFDNDECDSKLKTMLADEAVISSGSTSVVDKQAHDPSPQPFVPVNVNRPVSDERIAPQHRAENTKKDKKSKKEQELPLKDDRAVFESGEQPKKVKRSPVKKIIAIIAVVLVVAILGTVFITGIAPKLGKTTVNGKDIDKDSTSYSFWDTSVTADMLEAVNTKLKKLDTLNFVQCSMDTDAVSYLVSMNQLTSVHFEGCPFPDFSFLSKMPQLKFIELTLCGLNDESFAKIDFSVFTNLIKIRLNGNEDLSDLSPLGSKSSLEGIEANQCKISDLSFLEENFPSLEDLYLASNKISDLSGMEKLSNLQYLMLNYNEITDLSPLSGLELLYQVYLNNNSISDISALANKTNLRYLNLDDNAIENVEALSSDKALIELFLKNNKITDLSGLEQNIHLTKLSLSNNKITDISPLVNTTLLTDLSLNDNQVSDISPLANTAAALERVYFNNNNVSDISVLSASSSIQYISFDNNQVSDVSPLQKCTSLEGISAEHNQITSLSAFSGCENLQYLYLSFNQIEDISPISNVNTAQSSSGKAPKIYINLSNNNIKKLSFGNEMTYSYLAIHGNPITEISNLPKEATYLSISYFNDLDPAVLENSTFNIFQVVDCPLDKQVSFEEKLNKGFHSTVSFATEEEANAAIAAQKHRMLYGDSMDDPAANPESATESPTETQPSVSATE